MSVEAFIERAFRPDTLAVINCANGIIRDYQAQGFTLTLRQLYYQFVSRDLLANKQSEYKRLGSIINDGRLAGLIDWSAIEDRTRNIRGGEWGSTDPSDAIRTAADGYTEDLWPNQPRHVEIWIEKDALIGVIEPVCRRWRLPYLGCRGYISQSEQYAAGKRFGRFERAGRAPVVIYLGDHDPSGKDMDRDHRDRLAMFARWPVEVRRLALNMDQIEQYNPPPNPAKETDSRAMAYIAEFGDSSWELDALEPTVIDELIEAELQGLIDRDQWDFDEAEEEKHRSYLQAAADRWGEIEAFLGDDPDA